MRTDEKVILGGLVFGALSYGVCPSVRGFVNHLIRSYLKNKTKEPEWTGLTRIETLE